ncbi:MAG: hypothetical protein Q9M12_04520 [Mariprofundus sp.]|nr:hypothetical protein [Mariprofundus sp.]
MSRSVGLIMLASMLLLGGWVLDAGAFELDKDYLYSRDANVPPFQKSREFFDMPDRPGSYEVIMISENIGPLTFRMVRVHGEQEKTLVQRRSYSVGNHEFEARFDNPSGNDDLIVEIANSNPVASATVSVFVIEISGQ